MSFWRKKPKVDEPTIFRRTELILTRVQLIQALRKAGFPVADTARIAIRGINDERSVFDDSNPLAVVWNETESVYPSDPE